MGSTLFVFVIERTGGSPEQKQHMCLNLMPTIALWGGGGGRPILEIQENTSDGVPPPPVFMSALGIKLSVNCLFTSLKEK